METSTHIVACSILTVIFYPFIGLSSLLIFVGGLLVDVDHVLWYIYKTRDFNLKRCFEYFMKSRKPGCYNMYEGNMTVFHTMEFVLLMLFLSTIHDFMLIINIGLIVHLMMDIIDRIMHKIGFINRIWLSLWFF